MDRGSAPTRARSYLASSGDPSSGQSPCSTVASYVAPHRGHSRWSRALKLTGPSNRRLLDGQHQGAQQVGEPTLVGDREGVEEGSLVAALVLAVPVEGPLAGAGQRDVHLAPVVRIGGPSDQAVLLERGQPGRQGPTAQSELLGELRGLRGVRGAQPTQREQDLERRTAEVVVRERRLPGPGEVLGQQHQASDDLFVKWVHPRQLALPQRDVTVDGVLSRA